MPTHRPARVAVALLALCALPLAASDARRPAALAPDEESAWITLDADAFAIGQRVLPARAGEAPLLRLGEARGVVLARLPAAAIDRLSAALHRELGRCGGFVAHASRAAGEAELARLELRALTPEAPAVLPFAVDQPGWVAEVAGAVDEDAILATIATLSTAFANRYHAHPSGTASAHWIRDLWAGYAAARPEVTVALYDHPAGVTVQPSVVLTIPGTTLPSEVVVLGGHQDSTRSGCSTDPDCVAPGADDDASGIATLSELIRVALASGYRPQRTVQVMAYAAEEVGLRGSADIAADYLAAGTDVVAVLQQDMTGYFGSVEDVALISDAAYTDADLTGFLGQLLDAYQPGLVWTTTACGYGCSDHVSWQTRGYPAAFAFEARMGEHNAALHTAGDTVATLGDSAAHAAKFARLAAAFLVETGTDGPDALIFADAFEGGTTDDWTAVGTD